MANAKHHNTTLADIKQVNDTKRVSSEEGPIEEKFHGIPYF